jgi:hypothetical protein
MSTNEVKEMVTKTELKEMYGNIGEGIEKAQSGL